MPLSVCKRLDVGWCVCPVHEPCSCGHKEPHYHDPIDAATLCDRCLQGRPRPHIGLCTKCYNDSKKELWLFDH